MIKVMGDCRVRMVDPIEWNLSGMSDRDRTARLLNPATGEDLIIAVAAEAFEAAIQGRSSWSWQDGEHLAGCGRAIASFPLKADTFDYSSLPTVLISEGFQLTLFREEEVNLETAFMSLTKGLVQ